MKTLLFGATILLLAVAVFGHFEDPTRTARYAGMTKDQLLSHFAEVRNPNSVKRSTARSNGCQGCYYAFESPVIPSFDLPSAQPNSPGDVTLNALNPIVHADGSPLLAGCNGQKAQYLDNEVWTSYYTDNNGQKRKLQNEFYVTGSQLKIRTIQQWQSNLESVLSGKQVRLDITCDNGVESCLHFVVNGEPKVDTCDECAGLINRTAEDNRLIALHDAHFLYEIIVGDLEATLGTFPEEGSVVFYGSGMGGFPTYGPPGSNSVEDFYPSYVMYGKFFESQTDTVLSIVRMEVSDDHIYLETLIEFNHTAEFYPVLPGVPPTFKKARFPFLVVFEFDVESGLIIQERTFWDQATIFKQLGLLNDPSLPVVGGEFFDKIYDVSAGPEFNTFCCLDEEK